MASDSMGEGLETSRLRASSIQAEGFRVRGLRTWLRCVCVPWWMALGVDRG